jgi:hypothetical protein
LIDDPADILDVLTARSSVTPFREHVVGFEPEILEVAALLVKNGGYAGNFR